MSLYEKSRGKFKADTEKAAMRRQAETGVDATINPGLLAAITSQKRGTVSPSEPPKGTNAAETLTLNF